MSVVCCLVFEIENLGHNSEYATMLKTLFLYFISYSVVFIGK